MWTIDEQNGDLVWSQPQKGIAPSALLGTANLQNVNIATQPGAVMASFGRENQAQAAISAGTLTPDGATLFDGPSTLKSGTWIKVTASTVSSITAATNPTALAISYLMTGGGGGGGGAGNGSVDRAGGGGGAGEFVETTTTLETGKYRITIGAGGTAGSSVGGGNGGASSIFDIDDASTVDTAVGGGGGGGTSSRDGKAGGSAGGGGVLSGTGTGTGGTATAGNDGGDAGASGYGGGGGGADAAGASAGGTGGAGGNGTSSTISGTATTYAGGGGGGDGTSGSNPGAGGDGGGGGGGRDSAGGAGSNATPGSGGGGGGAGLRSASSGSALGGAGGSGIVIISYASNAAIAFGGDVTYVGGNTIHTFTEDGAFEVVWVNPGGLYYVSYADDSDQFKLSSLYDPYGTNVVTHGTTGSITFDTLATPNQPIAKATERYYTATTTEYRYYILDANSRVWVYDTLVYSTTLAANDVGVTWMLPDQGDYLNEPIKGLGVLNGWLMYITKSKILGKPSVTLGVFGQLIKDGYLTNTVDDIEKYAYVGSQGTLLYTDGNYVGEIFPTSSLITSSANVQSFCEYTGGGPTGLVGTIDVVIGGSVPYLNNSNAPRIPAVFFTEEGGTLPDDITDGVVYFIEWVPGENTFLVYTALTGGTQVILTTGASGTQYFNTFYPIGADAGSNGTNPTLQLTTQRVNLPFYETAKRLLEVGNTVLIGCVGNIVYPWNQVDALPSEVITLPEADVNAMLNVNNTAYIFCGNKGIAYITNLAVAAPTLKIPDYTAGVPGTANSYIEPTFTWGDAEYVRGRVYCSILDQTAAKAGNCGGVWSFIPSENIDPEQAVGTALRLESQNSYGDYDGYAPILIVNKQQTGKSPKYWAAWQDGYNASTAAFGIDYSTENPVTGYVVETDLLPSGTFLDKKTFEQLEYKLAVPMVAGDSVQLYWRTNPIGSWTSAGTVEEETSDRISGLFRVNFQKTQWTQIRAVVTTSGSASTSTFVPLSEIRLR